MIRGACNRTDVDWGCRQVVHAAVGQVGAVRHGEVVAAQFRFSRTTELHLRLAKPPFK